TIDGGAGSDTLDLSQGPGSATVNTGTGIVHNGFGGTDQVSNVEIFKTGGGDDTFFIGDDTFGGIDGGGGIDRIPPTASAEPFALPANASKISNIEVIDLTQSSGATLSLTAPDISTINSSGHSLYVIGGSDDEVVINNAFPGDQWTLDNITHTNAAVAPGVTFFHFHNTATGADLYVDDLIAFPIAFEPGSSQTDTDFPALLEVNQPPTIFLD